MKVLWNWMVAGLLVSVSRCDATASSAVISGVARRYVLFVLRQNGRHLHDSSEA
jgi:hypothetical protein